jgi:hypothetical protein
MSVAVLLCCCHFRLSYFLSYFVVVSSSSFVCLMVVLIVKLVSPAGYGSLYQTLIAFYKSRVNPLSKKTKKQSYKLKSTIILAIFPNL